MLSSRGVRVPVEPRTWRMMLPRFTVSGHTADASTVGDAGFNRETPYAAAERTTTAIPIQTINWRRFFSLMSGRAISIALGYLHLPCQFGPIQRSHKAKG